MDNLHKNAMTHIREGMDVYDVNGDKLGSVVGVYFGDEDPNRPGAETASAPRDTTPDTFVENLAEALNPPDDMPEELRQRLQRHGFIKVDTGILRQDRYVMPEMIAGVGDDRVDLKISSDEALHTA